MLCIRVANRIKGVANRIKGVANLILSDVHPAIGRRDDVIVENHRNTEMSLSCL